MKLLSGRHLAEETFSVPHLFSPGICLERRYAINPKLNLWKQVLGFMATLRDQNALEQKVCDIYKSFASAGYRNRVFLSELWREEHLSYLQKGIGRLPASFTVLDSSRPWLCYWILHAMALLGHTIDPQLKDDIVDFLKRCEDPSGGYGGGPGQMAHLATTYAAVCALITVGGPRVLGSINRDKILEFLLRMKDPSGGFRLHEGGEMDVRGCYTAIAVAYILDILVPALVEKVGKYIASCQTYEGGIGGEPGVEAHGGYTFCGLAAAMMCDQVDALDLSSLLSWIAFRQGKVEGGFQGRTNKLVDGCYSFWQGGAFKLLQQLMNKLISQQTSGAPLLREDTPVHNPSFNSPSDSHRRRPSDITRITAEDLFPAGQLNPGESRPLYNTSALQGYLLLCCQVLNGGLIDKPGKSKDYYHTCYCLSGLSTAQHSFFSDDDSDKAPAPNQVFGHYNNLLKATDPLLNIESHCCREAAAYFRSTKQ